MILLNVHIYMQSVFGQYAIRQTCLSKEQKMPRFLWSEVLNKDINIA